MFAYSSMVLQSMAVQSLSIFIPCHRHSSGSVDAQRLRASVKNFLLVRSTKKTQRDTVAGAKEVHGRLLSFLRIIRMCGSRFIASV